MTFLFSLALAVAMFIASLGNIGHSLWVGAQLSINVTQPLQQAVVFQSPEDALPMLKQSYAYLQEHDLLEGNTCLVFRNQPSCNLHFFGEKVATDIELMEQVAKLPISDVRVTNAMHRIYQSLMHHSEDGDSIVIPDYNFAIRYGTLPGNMLLAKAWEWFCGAITVLCIAITLVWAEN